MSERTCASWWRLGIPKDYDDLRKSGHVLDLLHLRNTKAMTAVASAGLVPLSITVTSDTSECGQKITGGG